MLQLQAKILQHGKHTKAQVAKINISPLGIQVDAKKLSPARIQLGELNKRELPISAGTRQYTWAFANRFDARIAWCAAALLRSGKANSLASAMKITRWTTILSIAAFIGISALPLLSIGGSVGMLGSAGAIYLLPHLSELVKTRLRYELFMRKLASELGISVNNWQQRAD